MSVSRGAAHLSTRELCACTFVNSPVPDLPFSIDSVEDSGTFELRFDIPRLSMDPGTNYLANVADIGSSLALAIDGRNLLRVEPPGGGPNAGASLDRLRSPVSCKGRGEGN